MAPQTGLVPAAMAQPQGRGGATAAATAAVEEEGDAPKWAPPGGGQGGPGGPGGPGGRGRRFPGGGPGFGGGEAGIARMALDFSMLNLTEEQKNKIKATREKNTARAREIKQALMTKRGEFFDLMFSDTSTNDQILAKRDEIRALKDEQENLMLNDFLANRAVLTPEQRKKRAEMKPEMPMRKMRAGRDQVAAPAEVARGK
ncbi:MAG: periplasmic heavy metal sensor [Cyanobacteria bacterium SZAS TMP-1]|nr:periplasmic heavy metal sensor [Cyanobacteria bacterium SZAS TMP-1]